MEFKDFEQDYTLLENCPVLLTHGSYVTQSRHLGKISKVTKTGFRISLDNGDTWVQDKLFGFIDGSQKGNSGGVSRVELLTADERERTLARMRSDNLKRSLRAQIRTFVNENDLFNHLNVSQLTLIQSSINVIKQQIKDAGNTSS